ncbi:hypothetical protein WP8W19C02_28180 [Enterobacter cloacae]|nr:hypothetical protein WP8W19C02_28180 [Enterobacter cloacae]
MVRYVKTDVQPCTPFIRMHIALFMEGYSSVFG